MRFAPPDIVDRMSIDYLMWNTYVGGRLSALADPIALPAGELGRLADLSERFARILEKTVRLVLEDPALLEYYCFDPLLRRLIKSDRDRGCIALARYDAFLTADGWKFSEFNCDVPGGIHEAAGLSRLIGKDRSPFCVVERLTDALCRWTVRPTIAVCYASGYAEDLEQCQYLRREWSRVGLQAILCTPEHLVWNGHDLRAFGQRVDAVYRFFPGDWMREVRNVEAFWSAAQAGRLVMTNGFSSLVAQSKKTMALWHERLGLFSPAEQELIRLHVPRTEAFRQDGIERYRRDRDRLVIKRQFGRIGEEVLMGSLSSDEEWAAWMDWPASEPEQWIVQQRFDPLPIEVDGVTLYGCFGPYVVDGRYSGLYSRFARDGFIAYDAYVGAVVEA